MVLREPPDHPEHLGGVVDEDVEQERTLRWLRAGGEALNVAGTDAIATNPRDIASLESTRIRCTVHSPHT